MTLSHPLAFCRNASCFSARQAQAELDAATRRVSRATTRRGVARPRVESSIDGKVAHRITKDVSCRLKFASWNVRSLVNVSGPVQTDYVRRGAAASKDVDDGRINVVVSELKRLGIEVAGVQETHWFGQDVYSVGNSTVLARGRPLPADGEAFRRGDGVAIILRGRALEAWKAGGSQWRPV